MCAGFKHWGKIRPVLAPPGHLGLRLGGKLLHRYSVRPGGPGGEGRVEIEVEARIQFQVVFVDFDHVHLVIALKVDFAEIVLVQEIVGDDQPLVVVSESDRNRAIEADPGFAPAYAGLADAYIVAGTYGSIPTQEALTRGKLAAAKALELDDKLASAHYALATAYTWYDWDWSNAEKEFQRGLALNPNDVLGRNWYGGYLSVRGRHQEALDEHERALELDPFSLIINANLVRSLYWGRRYDDAIIHARKTLQMDPKFGVALLWLEGSLRHKGMFKEAVALRQAFATPEHAQLIAHKFQTSGFAALLRENAERFKKDGSLVEAARCFAQIGEKEQALSLLEDCYQRRCSSIVTLKAEPDFDVLRTEARYQDLERRLGLQQF